MSRLGSHAVAEDPRSTETMTIAKMTDSQLTMIHIWFSHEEPISKDVTRIAKILKSNAIFASSFV
jgi:hypothetical protein